MIPARVARTAIYPKNVLLQASLEKQIIQNHMALVSDGMRVYEGIRTERLKGWTVMGKQFYSLDLPVRTK